MFKKLFTVLFCACIAIVVQAQNIVVSGTVTDGEGEPLIGASVVEKAPPVTEL